VTYCVGWKTSSSIFVVADTGVTGNNSVMDTLPIDVPQLPSSFGECSSTANNQFTEEAIYKVHQVNEKIIFGYAGRIRLGHQFLQLLKSALQQSKEAYSAITSAIASCTPLANPNDLQAVIGCFVNNKPILLAFNADGMGKLVEVDAPVHLGSARSFLSPTVDGFVRSFIANGFDDQHHLPLATSIMQHFSVHNLLPALNAAGIFFGGQLTNERVVWQRDTIYCLYAFHKGSLSGIDYIRVFFRNGILVVCSTLSNSCRFIDVSDGRQTDLAHYEQKLERLIGELKNERRAKFYVFLSKMHRTITVVDTDYNCSTVVLSVTGQAVRMTEVGLFC